MRALITGGGGFIGSHLARSLVEAGHEVDLVDDLSRGALDTDLEALLERPGVRLLRADLRQPDALDGEVSGYEWIFHLAAIVGVANVLEAPYRVLHDNVALTLNLLRFAAAQPDLRRFVFASTSEVYAGTLDTFGIDVPTPESVPITLPDLGHPRTSYMLSKAYGEALCHQAGLPFTIIRPHNVYGPRMGLSHVIPELLSRAHHASGSELEVFSIDHRRTFCFVEDAVAIVHAATGSADCAGEVLNVGRQAPEITIGELAQLVVDVVGRPLRIVGGPTHPGSPARRAPDTTKADRLTGHTAKVTVEEGVARTYEWYRANAFELVR